MYDIEKELRELKPINHTPTEAFRQQTIAMLKTNKQKRSPRKLVFSLSAAVVVAIAMLFVMLPMVSRTSYYTLDINPSVQFRVNAKDIVTEVSSANEDADELLSGTKLEGMPIKDALQSVIELAYVKEYLAPGGHVLVAHFGDNQAISDIELKDMVDDITPGINVLLICGEKSNFEEAQEQEVQAGISLLKEQAADQGIAEIDVDDIISLLCSEHDEQVPVGNVDNSFEDFEVDEAGDIGDDSEDHPIGFEIEDTEEADGNKPDKEILPVDDDLFLDNEEYDDEEYDDEEYDDEECDDEEYDDEEYDDEEYDDEGYDDEEYDDEGHDNEEYNDEEYDGEEYSDEGYDDEEYDNEEYDDEEYDYVDIDAIDECKEDEYEDIEEYAY